MGEERLTLSASHGLWIQRVSWKRDRRLSWERSPDYKCCWRYSSKFSASTNLWRDVLIKGLFFISLHFVVPARLPPRWHSYSAKWWLVGPPRLHTHTHKTSWTQGWLECLRFPEPLADWHQSQPKTSLSLSPPSGNVLTRGTQRAVCVRVEKGLGINHMTRHPRRTPWESHPPGPVSFPILARSTLHH